MSAGGPLDRLEDRMQAALDRHRYETDRDLKEMRDDLDAYEKRVGVLERWQAWVLGAFAAVAVLVSFVAKGIAKKLGWD